MSILAKLFGQCVTIRFEGKLEDGTEFTGKTKVESFNNSNEDVEKYLINAFYVETGRKAKTIKITGIA